MERDDYDPMEHGNQKFHGDLEYHVLITVTSEKPQRAEQKCLQVTGTKGEILVDLGRFELPTPWLQTRCSPN